MATLDQSYDKSNIDNISATRYASPEIVYRGHQFTAGASGVINKINLALGKNGSPTGNVWVEIWSDNGSDTPNSIIGGASSTKNVSTLSTSDATTRRSEAWDEFTWSSNYPTVVSGTKYWIIIAGNTTFSNTNYIRVYNDNSSPTSSGIDKTYTTGTGWGSTDSTDIVFEDYLNPDSTDYSITIGQGSFTLTGKNILLHIGKKLSAVYGSFVLTGKDILLKLGKGIHLAYGAFTLTGQRVALNNLIGYWALEESPAVNGTTIVDRANGYNGTLTIGGGSSGGSVAGRKDNAIDFEITDYVDCGDIFDFGISDFSISAWIYPKGYVSHGSGYNVFLGKGSITITPYFVIRTDSTDRITFIYGDVSNNKYRNSISTGLKNNWYHVVAVRQGGKAKLYINGVSQGESIAQDIDVSSVEKFYLNRDKSASRISNSKLDEVGVWNKALSDDEITALYESYLLHYNIVVENGSLVLTGENTLFHLGRKMLSEAGSFILTGFDTLFKLGWKMLASVGSFTFTGKDVLLHIGKYMSAVYETFTLTGKDILLHIGWKMNAVYGSFILTGKNIILNIGRKMSAVYATFALTGQNILFSVGHTLVAVFGSFTLTGFIARFPIYWRTLTKNIASFTNSTKHSSTWTNEDKSNTV
jgi:hypothetical protein